MTSRSDTELVAEGLAETASAPTLLMASGGRAALQRLRDSRCGPMPTSSCST